MFRWTDSIRNTRKKKLLFWSNKGKESANLWELNPSRSLFLVICSLASCSTKIITYQVDQNKRTQTAINPNCNHLFLLHKILFPIISPNSEKIVSQYYWILHFKENFSFLSCIKLTNWRQNVVDVKMLDF